MRNKYELLQDSKRCVAGKVTNGLNYKRKPDEDMFHLDYGDPAIEVLHVLSVMDMKMIEYLENCVRELEPELFVDRSSVGDRNFTYGGANVTYLTGLFHEVLPDVHARIVDAASNAMIKYSNLSKKVKKASYWDLSLSNLGIRSVEYTSFEHKQSKMTLAERKKWRERAREDFRNGKVTVTLGGDSIVDESELTEDGEVMEEDAEIIPYKYDPQADEHLGNYLHYDKKGRYSFHINLSDRAHFHGGDVMIRKTLTAPPQEEGGNYHPEFHSVHESREDVSDEYDDEESMDIGEIVGVEKLSLPEKKPFKTKKEAPGPKYHVMDSEIGRYTPERGSVIVLRDDFENGMQPLINGRRHGLIIEFWRYKDSPVGETRPEVGVPLSDSDEL